MCQAVITAPLWPLFKGFCSNNTRSSRISELPFVFVPLRTNRYAHARAPESSTLETPVWVCVCVCVYESVIVLITFLRPFFYSASLLFPFAVLCLHFNHFLSGAWCSCELTASYSDTHLVRVGNGSVRLKICLVAFMWLALTLIWCKLEVFASRRPWKTIVKQSVLFLRERACHSEVCFHW